MPESHSCPHCGQTFLHHPSGLPLDHLDALDRAKKAFGGLSALLDRGDWFGAREREGVAMLIDLVVRELETGTRRQES